MAYIPNSTNVDFDKMIFKSIEEAWFYDLKNTSTVVAMLDEITSGEFSGEESETEVNGKNQSVLAVLKSNKKFNVNIENAYVTATGLAMQNGTTVKEASATDKIEVERQELVDCSTAGKLNISDNAKAAASPVVYEANNDGTPKGSPLTGATVTDKVVSVAGATVGKKYIVIYKAEASVGKLIVNDADSFATSVRGVFNVIGLDPCTDAEYLIQVTVPKLSIKGNYTYSMGDNPATMSIEGTAQKSVCGGGNLCTFAIL